MARRLFPNVAPAPWPGVTLQSWHPGRMGIPNGCAARGPVRTGLTLVDIHIPDTEDHVMGKTYRNKAKAAALTKRRRDRNSQSSRRAGRPAKRQTNRNHDTNRR